MNPALLRKPAIRATMPAARRTTRGVAAAAATETPTAKRAKTSVKIKTEPGIDGERRRICSVGDGQG